MDEFIKMQSSLNKRSHIVEYASHVKGSGGEKDVEWSDVLWTCPTCNRKNTISLGKCPTCDTERV